MAKCSLSVNVSSIKASHSFWKMASSPGTEVADTGRGRTAVGGGVYWGGEMVGVCGGGRLWGVMGG